jgi:hypothetical protein
MKSIAIYVTTTILLTGCSMSPNSQQTDIAPSSSPKSQEFLETGSACRDVERQLIRSSLIFEETIAFTGVASTRESSAFFDELGALSQQLVEISFTDGQVAEDVKTAASLLAADVAEVQGLGAGGFAPVAVRKSLKGSLAGLFSACGAWVEISTNVEDLFFSPELIEFSVELFDDPKDDPLTQKMNEVFDCYEAPEPIIARGGFWGDNSAGIKSYVEVFCANFPELLILQRHSSNLQSMLFLRNAIEDSKGGSFEWFYSDQFTGHYLPANPEDREASRTLADQLGMKLWVVE